MKNWYWNNLCFKKTTAFCCSWKVVRIYLRKNSVTVHIFNKTFFLSGCGIDGLLSTMLLSNQVIFMVASSSLVVFFLFFLHAVASFEHYLLPLFVLSFRTSPAESCRINMLKDWIDSNAVIHSEYILSSTVWIVCLGWILQVHGAPIDYADCVGVLLVHSGCHQHLSWSKSNAQLGFRTANLGFVSVFIHCHWISQYM